MRHTTHCTIAAPIVGCTNDRISVVFRVGTWRQLLGNCLYLLGVKRRDPRMAVQMAHSFGRRELLSVNQSTQGRPTSWSTRITTS